MSSPKRPRTEARESTADDIVILSYDDLQAGKDLTADIRKAYGPGGLGILFVRGVPGVEEAREALLPLSRRLARLPEEILSKYEHDPPVIGWSRGKELFKGKPDTAKGSFYANPIFDDVTDGNEDIVKACNQTLPNVWPTEIPGFEQAFKKMGSIVYEVSKPIVKQVDGLVTESSNGAVPGKLYQRTFPESKMIVARLLHYYAISAADDLDDWCGWHNDNSTITGLVPAMWLDEDTGARVPAPKGVGLFVESRDGEQVHVNAPPGCLGFQIGEAAQVLSGGIVHATPHMVKGYVSPIGGAKLSRETLAVFIEPNFDGILEPPEGADYDAIFEGRKDSARIPALRDRLKAVPTKFGEFLQNSFELYYNMNNLAEGSGVPSI